MVFTVKDGSNPRDVALYALLNINMKGRKSNVFIRETLDKNSDLSARDKALCEHIVEGTLSRLYSIDGILSQYSKTPVKELNPYIREILRLSVCQLIYMDRIPKQAVLNEAVELAKRRGLTGLSGYVNGVLRSICRDMEKLKAAGDKELKGALKEGYIRWSVPEWLYNKLTKDFGIESAESIFSAWLTLRKVSVRFNLSKGLSEEEIKIMTEEDGITAERLPGTAPVYELNGLSGMGVGSLKAFKEGFITVQDSSAAALTEYCPPKKGDRILDICAAPGGKTLLYADSLCGTGFISSRDISREKTDLIKENVSRCGFENITVSEADASIFDKKSEEAFDIVIADLPCSGLGVAAKKPDIKKNITPETITGLRDLQRKILANAVRYLKKGGRLVYSTCTVTKEENEENADFIGASLGLKPLNMKRIMPGEHCDGFFIAVFEKK